MKPLPIEKRILLNFTEGMGYWQLEHLVFPPDDWPRAYRYSSNGGPPGCRRVLMAALRRYGYWVSSGYTSERRVYLTDQERARRRKIAEQGGTP